MKLIVLRHGESLANHSNMFCGWLDIQLSPKGQDEAKHAGQLISTEKLNIKRMYTSKLSRSIETGHIILKELDLLYIDHYKNWELNERHYGAFQGRNRKDVYKEIGEQDYNYIRRNYFGKPPAIEGHDASIDSRYDGIDVPHGESLKEVMDRFIPFLNHIISESGNLDLLLITHGSVVRSIIKHLNNVEDSKISSIEIPTGIPIVFELDDTGRLVKPYYYLDNELALRNIKLYQDKTSNYKM